MNSTLQPIKFRKGNSVIFFNNRKLWRNIPDDLRFTPLNYFQGIFALISDGYGKRSVNRDGIGSEIMGQPIYIEEKNLDPKIAEKFKVYLEINSNRYASL